MSSVSHWCIKLGKLSWYSSNLKVHNSSISLYPCSFQSKHHVFTVIMRLEYPSAGHKGCGGNEEWALSTLSWNTTESYHSQNWSITEGRVQTGAEGKWDHGDTETLGLEISVEMWEERGIYDLWESPSSEDQCPSVSPPGLPNKPPDTCPAMSLSPPTLTS